VRLEQQHVDRLQLLHVSVSLELLPYLCADGGDGEVERVHGLDLGCLSSSTLADFLLLPSIPHRESKHTLRIQSRYEERTRF
jgi:hypothetical protein